MDWSYQIVRHGRYEVRSVCLEKEDGNRSHDRAHEQRHLHADILRQITPHRRRKRAYVSLVTQPQNRSGIEDISMLATGGVREIQGLIRL